MSWNFFPFTWIHSWLEDRTERVKLRLFGMVFAVGGLGWGILSLGHLWEDLILLSDPVDGIAVSADYDRIRGGTAYVVVGAIRSDCTGLYGAIEEDPRVVYDRNHPRRCRMATAQRSLSHFELGMLMQTGYMVLLGVGLVTIEERGSRIRKHLTHALVVAGMLVALCAMLFFPPA